MKIFLSWSGDKSKAVALLLEEWIQCVIQAAEPWISTNIESGALWQAEINDQLAAVKIGIICITAENKEKPWILFEAGALAKGLSTSRVCTILIDLENSDIRQPLAQFNHIQPTKDGIKKLITTINAALEKPLPLHILEKVYDLQWPIFSEKFDEIIQKYPLGDNNNNGISSAVKTQKAQADMLIEILNTVRSFDGRISKLESVESYQVSTERIPSKIKQRLNELLGQGLPANDAINVIKMENPDVPRSVIHYQLKVYLNQRKSS